MIREIKFRIWDKEFGQMCQVSSIHGLDETPEKVEAFGITIPKGCRDVILTENNPLLQFAGLNDNVGREIYEGDIIKDGHGRLWEIIWVEACFMYRDPKTQGKMNHDGRIGVPYRLQRYLAEGFEVVGNIYENPELLNQQ